jgi:hypothetical protein
MPGWEYKVVPAPSKGVKAPGIKTAEARFANTLETLMNDMGADGWEFQRAETLPSIERAGLTGTTTEWRNVMVFRRPVAAPIDDFVPELLPAPAPAIAPEPAPAANKPTETAGTESLVPKADQPATDTSDKKAQFSPGMGATQMLPDNGVEETSEVSGMTASLKNLANQRKAIRTES